MSRVINFDKGSKRRIKQIRWSQFEATSAVVLALTLITLCLFFAIWECSDYSDQSQSPAFRDRR
jgi:hypothetical protein